MLVKFKTKKVKGLFIKVPDGIKELEFINLNTKYLRFTYNDEPLNLRLSIPTLEKWEIVGFSHKLNDTEIEKLRINYYDYLRLLSKNEIFYNYQNFTGQWVVLISALN